MTEQITCFKCLCAGYDVIFGKSKMYATFFYEKEGGVDIANCRDLIIFFIGFRDEERRENQEFFVAEPGVEIRSIAQMLFELCRGVRIRQNQAKPFLLGNSSVCNGR